MHYCQTGIVFQNHRSAQPKIDTLSGIGQPESEIGTGTGRNSEQHILYMGHKSTSEPSQT